MPRRLETVSVQPVLFRVRGFLREEAPWLQPKASFLCVVSVLLFRGVQGDHRHGGSQHVGFRRCPNRETLQGE